MHAHIELSADDIHASFCFRLCAVNLRDRVINRGIWVILGQILKIRRINKIIPLVSN